MVQANAINANLVTTNGIAKFNGTNLVNSTTALIDGSNYLTNSAQPSFLAVLNTPSANATGDGTVFTVPYNQVIFDNASGFTTGAAAKYTFPKVGTWLVQCQTAYAIASTSSVLTHTLILTSRSFQQITTLVINSVDTDNFSVVVDVAAITDTVSVTAAIAGGTKTSQISGSASPYQTFISGILLVG